MFNLSTNEIWRMMIPERNKAMELTFIGDIHCRKDFIAKMKPHSIQLGDFSLINYDQYQISQGPVYFVDGNHDYFPGLQLDATYPYEVIDNLYHIPRGFVSGRVLFVGGADSIDKDSRTSGADWFPEETLSYSQFNRIMDMNQPINVVVAHDCPGFVPILSGGRQRDNINTPAALAEIFYKFRPQLWVFGHHHKNFTMTLYNCKFVGLANGQHRVLDVPVDPKDF